MALQTAPLVRDFTVTCEHEGCTEQIDGLGNAHSIVPYYMLTGTPGIPAVQCDAEQHYACCTEHAVAVHIRCLNEHVLPKLAKHQQLYQLALEDQQRQQAEMAAAAAAAQAKQEEQQTDGSVG